MCWKGHNSLHKLVSGDFELGKFIQQIVSLVIITLLKILETAIHLLNKRSYKLKFHFHLKVVVPIILCITFSENDLLGCRKNSFNLSTGGIVNKIKALCNKTFYQKFHLQKLVPFANTSHMNHQIYFLLNDIAVTNEQIVQCTQ